MYTSWLFLKNWPLLIAFSLLLLLCVIFLILNLDLLLMGRRYRRLMRGVEGANLEAVLQEILKAWELEGKRLGQIEELCEKLKKTAEASIQRIGFVRFDAFSSGSELSFALALLDQRGDGIVLCCLVGRDDCRLFAKPVVGFSSSYPLSPEENKAIEKAARAADL